MPAQKGATTKAILRNVHLFAINLNIVNTTFTLNLISHAFCL